MIASRPCGGCTVCCRVLPIRTPELDKTSHVPCRHCHEGIGCSIYDGRPKLCRDYHCGWQTLEALPDSWRPDRSGVFVDRVHFDDPNCSEIPDHYDRKLMLQLLLLRPDAIEGPHFAEIVWILIDAGIPTFLGACGPPGHQNALVFLNEAAKSAVAARDRPQVMAVLRQAAAIARSHRFDPLPEPQPDEII